jgi:Protein of unknown function (DUF3341)
MRHRTPFYGLMAEFKTAEQILEATRRARREGYRRMDAYTPYPVEGLVEELALPRTRVPFVVFMGGLIGAGAGFFMQYWAMAVDYPLNVGGRPYNSWPAFIPVTFEMLILVAALSAILGMFFLNGLPEPYHPVFHVPRFARASQDRFFLCIEATDPRFDLQATEAFLASLRPEGKVAVVPH